MRFLSAVLTTVTILVYAIPIAAQAQGGWPIKAFEVVAEDPEPLSRDVGIRLRNPMATVRAIENREIRQEYKTRHALTPELKKEIEQYMGEVAHEFERLGLPPPQLDEVVTRADGVQAYRLYYFFFFENPELDAFGHAYYAYRCANEPQARRWIRINAISLTNGKRITDKGYGDLAHELFHAVQRGTPFYRRSCEPTRWITEGMAEAIGHDVALKLRGILSLSSPVTRWGLRPYVLRFATDGGDDPDNDYAYQTSSFWRFLAEMEHGRVQSRDPTHYPGPTATPPLYGTDYRYLSRLLSKADSVTNHDQALTWLDQWLRNDPGMKQSFADTYTAFVHAFAAYGKHRRVGKPQDAHVDTWLGKCQQPPPLTLLARSIKLKRYHAKISAGCVRLSIGDTRLPLSIDIRATAKTLAEAKQLHLAVVDDPRLSPAIVALKQAGPNEKDEGRAVASWSLQVQPNQELDLLFITVNPDQPSATVEQHYEIDIALAGWAAELTEPAAGSAAAPKPASRKTRPTPQPGETTQDGLGSTAVERDEEGPPVRCSWPARDFGIYCGPMLNIHLKTVSTAMTGFGSVVTSGVGMAQALATMNEMGGAAGLGAAGMAALAAREQLAVDIAIPLPAYGQTGKIDGAKIIVRGGGLPERGAYGPTDVLSGAQTYFPASGQVDIESYSVTELRGTFTATLVELPTPNSSREDRPTLPSLGSVSGRFLITRPWEGDGRYQMSSPPQSQLMSPTPGQPAAASASSAPARNGPPSTRSGPGSGAGGAVGPCACTCEEKQAVFATMDDPDGINPLLPSADAMKMAMCTMACAADYTNCPE